MKVRITVEREHKELMKKAGNRFIGFLKNTATTIKENSPISIEVVDNKPVELSEKDESK